MQNIKAVSIQYLPSAEELDNSKTLKVGKFLFPGFTHDYSVHGKQIYGGKFRYKTGLIPEDAPEDKRDEIIQAKADLEQYYGKGTLDADNEAFWKEQRIKINKKITHLNLSVPEEKLLYYIIKGGGVWEIAPSYEEATEGDLRKRFYLIEPEQFADLSAGENRGLDKAIAKLVELDEEHTFDDLFLVHKVLVTSDRGTTKQTPKSALYKDLSDFIHGKLVKTDKKKTAKQFIEAYTLLKKDKKKLFITAYVKDASYFNYLTVAEDNQFQNIETKTKYGASIDKAVSFLSNPANQTELENVQARVEQKWKQ